MQHIIMITVPRKGNYIHDTIASCFNNANGKIQLDILIGSSDRNYLKEYAGLVDVNLFYFDEKEESIDSQLVTVRDKFNVNYYKALRHVHADGSIVIEDDVKFRDGWDTKLQQTIDEISNDRKDKHWALACYAPAGTPSCGDRDKSLKRGKYYSSYVANSFYGTQAMYYTRKEADILCKMFVRLGFDDILNSKKALSCLAADMLIKGSFSYRSCLYTTRRTLVQHMGKISTGLGHHHQSESFNHSWPT